MKTQKLPHCQGCPLFDAPGPVWGEGDREEAAVVYIGQNPGKVEASTGRPFTGPSGNVLNRQLYEIGARRSELYITNQVKCCTPQDRAPTPAEIAHCKPILQAELKACRAKVVVLSGAVAFKENIGKYSSLNNLSSSKSLSCFLNNHYFPSDNIMNRRGCVEKRDGRLWIGNIHPAFILRMPDFKQCGPDDLKKALLVAKAGVPDLEVRKHVTDPEVADYVHYILTETKAFAEDVETHGLGDVDEDDYIGGQGEFDICGISADGKSAIVLSREQTKLLAPVFAATDVTRYEHNGPFDNYHVSQEIPEDWINDRYLKVHRSKKFDTMLGAHYLRSYAPKKLKPYLLSVYTTLPYYDRKLELCDRRFYNAMDVMATWQAGKKQEREMENWKVREVFEEFGMPLLPELEEWRAMGVRADIRKVLLFRRFLDDRINRATLLISKIAGPVFNPESPKQVSHLLYDKWQLPKQYNGKGESKSLTTDVEARKTLRWYLEKSGKAKTTHKVPYYFLTLLDYIAGEQQKLTFLNRVASDGRIHPYFKAHGTESFRLSSKPNIQNIPIYDLNAWGGARTERKDEPDPTGGVDAKGIGSLRSIVIPDQDEDWILSVDYAQLQLYIYAIQYKVKWLLKIFESGDYLYGIVYEKLYNEPFFQAGKPRTKKYMDPAVQEQRIRRAKAVPLGFLFKRSGEAVAEEYGWTPEEGVRYRNWFYGLCPELPQSYDQIEFEMKQKGYLRQIFGNVMHFPGMKLSEAINSRAQSPEAFIMIGTILECAKELRRRGLRERGNRIMLSVHDSLSLNVTEADAEEVYEGVLKPILERAIPQLGGFRLKHSAEMSKSWDWKTVDYYEWKQQRDSRRQGEASSQASKDKEADSGHRSLPAGNSVVEGIAPNHAGQGGGVID